MSKLCECGCGKKVTFENNRFVHGHYPRGKDIYKEMAKKMGLNNLGRSHSEKTREKDRFFMSKMWKEMSYLEKEKRFLKIFKSCRKVKNKSELHLDNIIQEVKVNEFKYCGDYITWIGGKNPDWINVNGKKQVIELFGDFFHGEEYRKIVSSDLKSNKEHEKDRVNHFKKYGFDCLVIWECELKNLVKLKEKLQIFVGGK